MRKYSTSIVAILFFSACVQEQPRTQEQNQPLVKAVSSDQQIGPCEDCEVVDEYGDRILTWTDTLEDFNQAGPRISVAGTIYKPDGKTPAKDVILYLYHTDQTGIYPTRADVTGAGRRHGFLRTWLKTDAQGRYQFFTLRPASYPGGRNPAHIHAIVKEPGKQPYWIDDFLFDDDPYLTKEQRGYIRGRGGNQGVLKDGKDVDGVTMYKRDITLGLNVY